jgi:hypothetical protein
MSVAIVSEERAIGSEPEPVGIPLMRDALDEGGAYLCNWSGHQLRIHDPHETGGAAVGHAADAQSIVTGVGSDPYACLSGVWAPAGCFGPSTTP